MRFCAKKLEQGPGIPPQPAQCPRRLVEGPGPRRPQEVVQLPHSRRPASRQPARHVATALRRRQRQLQQGLAPLRAADGHGVHGPQPLHVQAVKAQDVDVTVISGALPTSGTFRTHQIITDVDELGEEFQSFWGQIWNRDRADTTWEDQEWDQARTLVAECGEAWPQIQVDWNDLDMWRAVLRQLPSGKARGVDGWSYEELRQLPDRAIEHLGQLMQRIEADGSFPQPAMQARTVLLPKQAQTEGMSGTRPITILGCLNRLWSRYVTAWIVPRWSQAFPEGIATHTGGLRTSISRQ